MRLDVPLVEANKGDSRLIREVLAEINPTVRLHVITDGAEAMDFLLYQRRDLHAPRPGVILLDPRLPRLRGREVLVRVKANFYRRKPGNWNDCEQVVKSLNNFWFMRIKLPQHKKRG